MDNKQVLYKPNKKKHFWTGGITSQKVVFSVVFVLFAIYALSMIIPFCVLILYSLENNIAYEINLGQPFRFPDKLVFDNYIYAFSELEYRGTGFFGMVFNSVWYTAIATVGPLLANTCVGYAVSKYKFKLRNVYYGVLIFCMTVPIIGTTGATMQLYADLRLYNTGPLLQLFTRLGAGGIGFLVIYAFFKNISWEYAEAALIDGAGHFTVFFRIMVPMAIPAMGALALINGIAAWNAHQDVLLYNPDWPTLASGLYGLSRTLPRLGNTPAYYAALVISLIPILIIFCLFSDKIMKNFSVGGLKG